MICEQNPRSQIPVSLSLFLSVSLHLKRSQLEQQQQKSCCVTYRVPDKHGSTERRSLRKENDTNLKQKRLS